MGYCTVRDGLNVMSLLNCFSSCKHMYKLRRLFLDFQPSMNKHFNVDSCLPHIYLRGTCLQNSNAYDFAHKLLNRYLLSLFLLSALDDPAAYLSDQEGFLFSAKAAMP